MKIILASSSPRRRELLRRVVGEFEVLGIDVDESISADIPPIEAVQVLAVRKGAAAVAECGAGTVIISSDTLVEIDGVPLGKPHSKEDAFNTLKKLSGRAHNVHTGVAVHYQGKCFFGVDTASVYFRELTNGEINEYVESGEPMDKAGSYAIQGEGGRFVLKYDGGFDTIMGLSLPLTVKLLNTALGGEIFSL